MFWIIERGIIMEDNKNVSISINLSEGSIIISGSENFVEKNMETVFSFVKQMPTSMAMPKTLPQPKKVLTEEDSNGDGQGKDMQSSAEKDKYKRLGIYSVDSDDGTISIHRKIPGKNNAEKMKNVALIVLYEKGEAIEGGTLKQLCEKQGCWDGNNSSAIFEREYTLFIKKKISDRRWTIALTIDGEQAAKDLLEGMLNDKK